MLSWGDHWLASHSVDTQNLLMQGQEGPESTETTATLLQLSSPLDIQKLWSLPISLPADQGWFQGHATSIVVRGPRLQGLCAWFNALLSPS